MLISNPQKIRHLPSQELDVKIQNRPLCQVNNVRYLGVEIDCTMSFNNHIDSVCSKISRSIGILKYCRFLPITVLKNLYNALVLPHFDYCSSVWSCTSVKNMSRLQRLQNRAMRCILKAPARAHIEEMLADLKWMSVKQRMCYNRLVLMWKILNNCVPNYLSNRVQYVHQIHQRQTRASANNLLFIPHSSQKSFYVTAGREWNDLPPNLKDIDVLESFKKKCTSHVLLNVDRF